MTSLQLQPLALDSLFILGELRHPVAAPAPDGSLTPLQLAQLIFVAAAPAEAFEAFQLSEAAFNRAAFTFQRGAVPLDEVPALVGDIIRAIAASTPRPPVPPVSAQVPQSTK